MDPTGNKNLIHFKWGLMIRWRRYILSLIAIAVLVFEIFEHPNFLSEFNRFFWIEVGGFFTLIFAAGVILEILIRSIAAKNLAFRILDARHNLSVKITSAKNWDEVIGIVVQFPSTLMPVSDTKLLMYDQELDRYQIIKDWGTQQGELNIPESTISKTICASCLGNGKLSEDYLVNCKSDKINSYERLSSFCLNLTYGNLMVGRLQLFIPQNYKLTSEQTLLLENTAGDIAVALNTAWQRRELRVMEVSRAADNERLEIARDLHDHLGQNLGFIHFKLDQILSGDSYPTLSLVNSELIRLRELANESYELIRNTLVILHFHGDRPLGELFQAQAYQISLRSGFVFDLHEEGRPQILPPHTIHPVFSIYKEALINIEKHAHASYVRVLLLWDSSKLIVKVEDDGQGFDLDKVDPSNHFGLKIMEDRLNQLDGELKVSSQPGQGTQIEFWVPFKGDLPFNKSFSLK